MHFSLENYYYLKELENNPHVVANYFKKFLKEMSEPLCTFPLYQRYRDLNGKYYKYSFYYISNFFSISRVITYKQDWEIKDNIIRSSLYQCLDTLIYSEVF